VAGFSDVNSKSAMSAQVLGLVLGPIVFGVDLLLSYSLVQHSCSTGHHYVLHAISVVCFVVVLAGGWMSWTQYQAAREANDEGGSPLDRAHFLGLLGVVTSVFFAVVIIANAVPRFILSPCD
jgi:hypothetical protein